MNKEKIENNRIPKQLAKHYGIEKDDTDSLIVFKESLFEQATRENIKLKKQAEQLETKVKEIEKEKMHNLLNDIKNGFREFKEYQNILYPLDQIQFAVLEEYIEQLETEKQAVINKLKEDKKEFTEELKYDITKREAKVQLNLVNQYLDMLGEKKYCSCCGVELNKDNKALNNMCNECKYGLDY